MHHVMAVSETSQPTTCSAPREHSKTSTVSSASSGLEGPAPPFSNNSLPSSPAPPRTSEMMTTSLPSPWHRKPRTPGFQPQETLQNLTGYYAELRALMDDGGAQDDSTEGRTSDNANSTASPSDDSYQPYRQVQTAVFKQFSRLDPTCRSIPSDNWLDSARRSNLASSALATPLSNPNHASFMLVSSSAHPQSIKQSSVIYTPTRSPRIAPITSSGPAAGFDQGIPVPPPTPESLSTPVSATSQERGGSTDATRNINHPSATASLASPPAQEVAQIRDEARNMQNTTAVDKDKDGDRNRDNSGNSNVENSNSSPLVFINVSQGSANDPSPGPRPGSNAETVTGSTSFTVTITANTLGYCFVRADGSRTRLVPVDMLPYQLQGIPASEPADDRLVPLPIPTGVGPDGRSSNSQTLTTVSNISGTPASGPKRAKIYCDKWVHEGVCAFTQQGCKYKHEMPTDKATQHQLGLFLGYPVWWKRRQGELARMTAQNAQNRVASARGPDTARPVLPEPTTPMERR
ncbi:hypothetical protein VTJ83DRAFT_7252 [Remersonia thermophila]|uniref:C3H1-type domain-containing protein n=1 Tax=Remersonia thermophila TaxID=72144 RepID=A0ABR4D2Z2_9PEZI